MLVFLLTWKRGWPPILVTKFLEKKGEKNIFLRVWKGAKKIGSGCIFFGGKCHQVPKNELRKIKKPSILTFFAAYPLYHCPLVTKNTAKTELRHFRFRFDGISV